jgi:hypothetical protein
MATAVVSKFIDSYLKGSDLRNMDIQLPMSDPSIFQKLVSVVSSTLNKTAIKMKFDGILAVLVPSHNKYRLFGGRLLDSFNSLSELQDLQLEMDQKPIDSSKLNMGCSYFRSELVNGKWVKDTSRLFTITPDVYWEIRNGTNDNVKFIEAICQLKKPDVLIKGEEYLIS